MHALYFTTVTDSLVEKCTHKCLYTSVSIHQTGKEESDFHRQKSMRRENKTMRQGSDNRNTATKVTICLRVQYSMRNLKESGTVPSALQIFEET